MQNYSELRQELRAFHSLEGSRCTNLKRIDAFMDTNHTMEEYAEFSPEADALDFRKEIYALMRYRIRPILFPHSPFYFELGGNGGWNRTAPGLWVFNHLSKKVFTDPAPEAWARHRARLGKKIYLICGPYFDAMHNNSPIFRLLKTGFRGIYEEALSALPECRTEHERKWIKTALAGLETVREISCAFGREAQKRLQQAETEEEKACMSRIAESAFTVPWEPPRTFYEALNLCAFAREITAELDGLKINTLGRPDAWLMDFYRADLAAGRITEAEAYDLICRFLLMGDLIYDKGTLVTPSFGQENEHTLTLGGCDEQGNEVFNELTEMFLRAYRELHCIYPKPHCRFSASSSAKYLRLIGDDILAGHGIYSLVNDDSLIPALTKTGHSIADARNYCCTGCWDIVCGACEDNSGGNYFNLASFWDAVIHKTDAELADAKFRPERIDHADSFEKVYSAIMGSARTVLTEMLHDETVYGRKQSEAYIAPLCSACSYDCLKNRKDFTEGGMRYNPHAVSLCFFGTFVDSFLAVQDLCFVRKICTVDELLTALRANWQGYETLRQQAMQAPHWGDDRPESTAMARRIADDFFAMIQGLDNEHGGAYQLGIWTYREILLWGKRIGATPDGRYAGGELSQSLNPSHFRNHEPLTTVLRNLAKLDLTRFAGNSVVNLCLERENFSPEAVEALIRTFAELKLQLLQLNALSTAELEEARIHPEDHQDLMVRVCGFSAKYVSLCPEWQEEIIQRRKF